MRSTYLIAAAVLLALLAAAALFGTDFFQKNPFDQSPDEGQLLGTMTTISNQGGFAATFAEHDVRQWGLAAGQRLERFSLDPTGGVFARLSSATPLEQAFGSWEQQGLFVRITPEFAQRVNGKKIEVGIVARSPQTNGAPDLSIAYATQQAGNSGWRTIPLTQRFQLWTFEWTVPSVQEGYHAAPIIVIHADRHGAGKAVEILGVYVKTVQ